MQITHVIPTQMPIIKDGKYEDKKGMTPILTEDTKDAKDCEKDI